jgi:hypothetical protein
MSLNVGCLALLGIIAATGSDLGDMIGHHMMHHPVIGSDAGFGGDAMERTFTKYNSLPINASELKAQGWTTLGSCNPKVGYQWTQTKLLGVVPKDKPLVLYTTEGGQISGVGVVVKGEYPENQKKWSQKKYYSGWLLEVAFRQGDIICSGKVSDALIGDVVILNPDFGEGGEKKSIPIFETDADFQGWHRGSCFDGMGWHRFLDTSLQNNKMSWKAENVLPVVAMYYGGNINALFFNTPVVQQSLTDSNEWEPVPLPDPLMCKNTCDSDCTFAGAKVWSTMHVFFRSHETVKCESDTSCFVGKPGSGSGISCCHPKDVVV